MTTLHLMVGLPCSGKTTLAKQLEQECQAIRLTPDDWQTRLFGNDMFAPGHDELHTLIESLLWEIAARVLALGIDVILDFGFWAHSEREDFRARAARLGADCRIHYLDVPEVELFTRMRERNAHPSPDTFPFPEEEMKEWMALFQKPKPDELDWR